MLRPSYIALLVLLCGTLACAGSQPVSFAVSRPPLLGLTDTRRVAMLGFNGKNIQLNARLNYLFTRQLQADTTITMIEPVSVLRELSRHAYFTGDIPDSIVLAVGRAVETDAVLIGELVYSFTEQYGEEKKFRVAEIIQPSNSGAQYRLANMSYREPYIDQTAVLTATIRALDVATGREIGKDRTTHIDTLHIVLSAPVENPPKEPVNVTMVTPSLLSNATIGLASRLDKIFTWHTVVITRYMKREIKGGDAGVSAVLKGDWDRARAIWEQMIREQPENPGAWNNLAIAYEQTGRADEAREAYDRALAIQPNDPMIQRNRAGMW